MSLIELNYTFKSRIASDINEHLPTLSKLAEECNSVIELGVRGVVSSWAFVNGLPKGSKMFMNDIEKCNYEQLMRAAKKEKDIEVTFVQGSDLDIPLPEPADIVFIDTWHVYAQLKRELARYEPLANKYIVMHDTTVDEWDGETIRLRWSAEEQSKNSGFPVDEINRGLWPAVDEFLRKHENSWELMKRYTNNNGLTILKRINQVP